MTRFFAILFLLFAASAMGANVYVRSGASGANNGTSWTDAYTTIPIAPSRGDTNWIATGTYSGGVIDGVDMSGDTWIVYKKATIADHGGGTGWNDSYAAGQANIGNWQIWGPGGYIMFDGYNGGSETNWGFLSTIGIAAGDHQAFDIVCHTSGTVISNVWFQYLQIVGPGEDTPNWTLSDGSSARGIRCKQKQTTGSYRNITVRHCYINGCDDSLHFRREVNGCLIEYNDFAYASSTPSHANVFYIEDVNSVIFRYNVFREFNAEGLGVAGVCSDWEIYGNVCYNLDDHGGYPRFIEFYAPSYGPYNNFKIYNNTCYGMAAGSSGGWFVRDVGTTYNVFVTNNISFDCNNAWGDVSHDYNWFNSGSAEGEANGVDGSGDPFVSAAGGDFHIVSTVSATMPRDKGASLAATYNTDPDGVVRGSDASGLWDIGAYEYNAGDTNPPVIIPTDATGTNGVSGFTYQIQASGSPTNYGCTNLPAGLSVGLATGTIAGTPTETVTNSVGLFCTNSYGWAQTNITITILPVAPVLWVSTNYSHFGFVLTNLTSDVTVTVSNAGDASTTLTGWATNASSPWSIVGNADYSITGTDTTNITLRYSPTSVSSNMGFVTFTGGSGQSNTLEGYAYPNLGTDFGTTNGLVAAPVVTNSAGFISVTSEYDPGSGLAVYGFSLSLTSVVQVTCYISATNTANNSWFVDMDQIPAGDQTVWDITNLTSGFEYRLINKRGTGTFAVPQYSPMQWSLAAGQHYIVFQGREANTQIKNIALNITPQASVMNVGTLNVNP